MFSNPVEHARKTIAKIKSKPVEVKEEVKQEQPVAFVPPHMQEEKSQEQVEKEIEGYTNFLDDSQAFQKISHRVS